MLESDGDIDRYGQENVSPDVVAALAAEEVMIDRNDRDGTLPGSAVGGHRGQETQRDISCMWQMLKNFTLRRPERPVMT